MHTAPITPLPSLRESGPVMLVGGTFDPPHIAHTTLARLARDAAAPGAQMYFVPAARSPHKDTGPEATDQQRVKMLNLALEGFDDALIWTDEIDRACHDEPSYWVTTLERARKLVGPARQILFLMGADQAASFDRWYQPERILELADAVVINRGDVQTKQELAELLEGTGFKLELLEAWCDVPSLDVSATEIRRVLSAHEKGDPADALHSEVALYIRQHNLYTGRSAL
jgi:nicotinate-nucleotide adenylyltransferase